MRILNLYRESIFLPTLSTILMILLEVKMRMLLFSLYLH